MTVRCFVLSLATVGALATLGLTCVPRAAAECQVSWWSSRLESREQGAYALERLGELGRTCARARRILIARLIDLGRTQTPERISGNLPTRHLVAALARSGSAAVPDVLALVRSTDARTRGQGLRALVQLGPQAVEAIEPVLDLVARECVRLPDQGPGAERERIDFLARAARFLYRTGPRGFATLERLRSTNRCHGATLVLRWICFASQQSIELGIESALCGLPEASPIPRIPDLLPLARDRSRVRAVPESLWSCPCQGAGPEPFEVSPADPTDRIGPRFLVRCRAHGRPAQDDSDQEIWKSIAPGVGLSE